MLGGVLEPLRRDWMRSKVLACLDWLLVTDRAKGQQDPQLNWFHLVLESGTPGRKYAVTR